MYRSLPLVLVLAASGCRDCAPDPSAALQPAPEALASALAGAAAPAAAPSDAAVAPSASGGAAALAPAPGGSAAALPGSPRVEAAPVDRAAYLGALGQGRAAARKGRYAEGIAAFDRALAAMPHEPRALAERGHARMRLGADLDAAAADLQRAEQLGPDDKLAAQIWYNLGLLDELRGEAELARAAFARSFLLSPTAAARAKAGPGMPCGVLVERREAPSRDDFLAPRLVVARGWLDAYEQLYRDNDPKVEQKEPATEAEAQRSLCERHGADRCTGPSPWLLTRYLNSIQGELEDHVLSRPDGSLLVFHAGMVLRTTDLTTMNRIVCIPEERLEVRFEPDVVHVTVEAELRAWKSEDEAAAAACDPGRLETEDLFYDAKTGRELVRLSRAGGRDTARVKRAGRTVEVAAGSCTTTVPLDVRAAAGAGRPAGPR
ncbi:tetratricopeptide repeat protein [Sorangium sp. So ce388]|uniref:tetratricopeptide repeat protein n=1 Tax=Sorangium sp. So ce388 TaxID=3133309 RepID=UPI003F5B5035